MSTRFAMKSAEDYMRLAIVEAARKRHAPFGAVIIESRDGDIVATGHNRTVDGPIWHGEIDAIYNASRDISSDVWQHMHLYTTAEPCCMCQGAILWAGISAVCYGTSIATLQRLGWQQVDIAAAEVTERASWASCSIMGSVLEVECDRLFSGARA